MKINHFAKIGTATFVIGFALSGCFDFDEPYDSIQDSDSDTDADEDNGTDTDKETDADTDKETDADTDKETDADTDTDKDSDVDGGDDDVGYCDACLVTLKGTVQRTKEAKLPQGEDGKDGTLCISLLDKCPSILDQDVSSVGGSSAFQEIQNADLSTETDQVDFEMSFPGSDIALGDYVVTAFYHIDGGVCPATGPAAGDLVTMNMTKNDKNCGEFSIEGDKDLTIADIKNTLNFRINQNLISPLKSIP